MVSFLQMHHTHTIFASCYVCYDAPLDDDVHVDDDEDDDDLGDDDGDDNDLGDNDYYIKMMRLSAIFTIMIIL